MANTKVRHKKKLNALKAKKKAKQSAKGKDKCTVF
jgi:hypothetical protein